MVIARNEGRDLRNEGPDILRAAAKMLWSFTNSFRSMERILLSTTASTDTADFAESSATA